jgi:hypothetical protein
VRILEALRQRPRASRNRDQMYMIRHQTVSQQRQAVEFGILSQQCQVSDSVSVAVKNCLARVAALCYMMSNVNDNHPR